MREHDRRERPALGSRGRSQARQVDHQHGDGDRQQRVRLRLARNLHDGGSRGDLEHVLGAGGRASGQRAGPGDHRREQRPRKEERDDHEPQGTHQPARGARLEPAHGERQKQVEREQERRCLGQDADSEGERRVRGLPGDDPGQDPERDQQRPESAGRTAHPPVQADPHRRRGQEGPVRRGGHRPREMLARQGQPDGHSDHRQDRARHQQVRRRRRHTRADERPHPDHIADGRLRGRTGQRPHDHRSTSLSQRRAVTQAGSIRARAPPRRGLRPPRPSDALSGADQRDDNSDRPILPHDASAMEKTWARPLSDRRRNGMEVYGRRPLALRITTLTAATQAGKTRTSASM